MAKGGSDDGVGHGFGDAGFGVEGHTGGLCFGQGLAPDPRGGPGPFANHWIMAGLVEKYGAGHVPAILGRVLPNRDGVAPGRGGGWWRQRSGDSGKAG